METPRTIDELRDELEGLSRRLVDHGYAEGAQVLPLIGLAILQLVDELTLIRYQLTLIRTANHEDSEKDRGAGGQDR